MSEPNAIVIITVTVDVVMEDGSVHKHSYKMDPDAFHLCHNRPGDLVEGEDGKLVYNVRKDEVFLLVTGGLIDG